jgi:hypothetical protein
VSGADPFPAKAAAAAASSATVATSSAVVARPAFQKKGNGSALVNNCQVLKEKEALEATVANQLAADKVYQEEKVAKAAQMGLSGSERLAAARFFEEVKLRARVADARTTQIRIGKIAKAAQTKPTTQAASEEYDNLGDSGALKVAEIDARNSQEAGVNRVLTVQAEKSAQARRMSTGSMSCDGGALGPATTDLAVELPPLPPPQAEALCHPMEALFTNNRNNGHRAGICGFSLM